MLRASSLGLCLPPSAFRGLRPCLLIQHRAGTMLENPLGPQILTNANQRFASSSHSLQTNGEECIRDGQTTTHTGRSGPAQHSETPSSPFTTVTDERRGARLRAAAPARLSDQKQGRGGAWWKQPSTSLRRKDVRVTAVPRPVNTTPPQQDIQPPPAPKEQESPSPPDHITEHPPYPTGRPWRSDPIQPLQTRPAVRQIRSRRKKHYFTSKFGLSISMENLRESLLHTMATTHLDTEAWDAYSNLLLIDVNIEGPTTELLVPFSHLHRLARLLSSTRPKTRKVFLRLLSVLTAIRNSGGTIHLHEWNSLIDLSGKGWRKTRTQDFETALSIYEDMTHGKAPGTTLANRSLEDEEEGYYNDIATPVQPDIYTHTTLVSLAARTLNPDALGHATNLLERSQLAPNRITHLSLLQYFTFTHQLSGVRSTLFKMRQQGFDLGIDGINSVIWAYGNNGRVDIVMMIYRLLRNNVSPERHGSGDDIQSVVAQLKREEQITVDPALRPNEITFTMMIQVMAYQGNLLASLTVFMDMISSQNLEMGAPLVLDENQRLVPTTYSPTLPVFRAIFLGFSRHALPPKRKKNRMSASIRASNPPGRPTWSLDNLQSLFDTFMDLPGHVRISQPMIFWIMVAFDKTSGSNIDVMRRAWQQLEDRFGGPWGEPGSRLHEMRLKLFPGDTKVFERKKWDYGAGHDLPPHLETPTKG